MFYECVTYIPTVPLDASTVHQRDLLTLPRTCIDDVVTFAKAVEGRELKGWVAGLG